MARSRVERSRKGQAVSIDASFGAVLALAAVLACVNAASIAAGDAAQSSSSALALSRAISTADYIVKEGAAAKEDSSWGTVARSLEIDEQLLGALDYRRLASRTGASSVCAELIRPNAGETSACSGGTCVSRPVVVHCSGEAAYVRVCVE